MHFNSDQREPWRARRPLTPPPTASAHSASGSKTLIRAFGCDLTNVTPPPAPPQWKQSSGHYNTAQPTGRARTPPPLPPPPLYRAQESASDISVDTVQAFSHRLVSHNNVWGDALPAMFHSTHESPAEHMPVLGQGIGTEARRAGKTLAENDLREEGRKKQRREGSHHCVTPRTLPTDEAFLRRLDNVRSTSGSINDAPHTPLSHQQNDSPWAGACSSSSAARDRGPGHFMTPISTTLLLDAHRTTASSGADGSSGHSVPPQGDTNDLLPPFRQAPLCASPADTLARILGPCAQGNEEDGPDELEDVSPITHLRWSGEAHELSNEEDAGCRPSGQDAQTRSAPSLTPSHVSHEDMAALGVARFLSPERFGVFQQACASAFQQW